jgi:hypothetical protein
MHVLSLSKTMWLLLKGTGVEGGSQETAVYPGERKRGWGHDGCRRYTEMGLDTRNTLSPRGVLQRPSLGVGASRPDVAGYRGS